jgi:hypothetical protein
VDGGVGFSGHADLAAEEGASGVVVVNPFVPHCEKGVTPLRSRGLAGQGAAFLGRLRTRPEAAAI